MRVFALVLLILFTTGSTCRKISKNAAGCFKARLAIKGICLNYVIEVLNDNTGSLPLEREWKDETDGKIYRNVFALGSRCTFPDMEEGDTFYFTPAAGDDSRCNVCLAYRPVPGIKNNIVVVKTPCP